MTLRDIIFGALHSASSGIPTAISIVTAHLGNDKAKQTHDAITKVLASGTSWITILIAMLPYLLTLLSGGAIDFPSMIAAILALLTPNKP